jgi:hypothetical protein
VLKSMPGGLFQWIPRGDFQENPVAKVARPAIDAGAFEPWTNRAKQAKAIDRGVWTLMSGSSYIWNVTGAGEHSNRRLSRLPDWLKSNTCALFKGYGWRSKQPEMDIERLAKYSIKQGRLLATSIQEPTESETA